jgi:L-iditol 2-dehydrogenase
MASMRALRVERPGRARLVEVERPRAGPGEVVVEVAAAGICGSDLELLRGSRPASYVRYPIVPGHEWAGRVAEVGAGVSGLATGDPVVAEGFRACGRCDRCKEGLTNLCSAEYAETGFTHPGAFADCLLVPARLVHRLPASADLAAAALLEPAACVAQGLLGADLRPGLRAAVVGAGTLGFLALAILRLTSPARLALVGTRPDRLALASRMGGVETALVEGDEDLQALADQFDLVFEAATRPEAGQSAIRLARRGGSVVLEGITGAAGPSLSGDLVVLKHLRVQGIFGASGKAWRWAVQLFTQGLDVGWLVTHRYPLEEHDRAFATAGDRAAGALKVQLNPSLPPAPPR